MTATSTTSAMPRTAESALATADWVARHWLLVTAAAALVAFAVLVAWQRAFPLADGPAPAACLQESFVQAVPRSCEQALLTITSAVQRLDPANKPGKYVWAWEEPGQPRLFVWLDNFFVDLYTLFFIGVCARSYARLCRRADEDSGLRDAMLVASILLALAGAVTDHAENFWLLAHINVHWSVEGDLPMVAAFSAWKFRLFALNAVLSAGWSFIAHRAKQNRARDTRL
jgi:hypothetical protein